MNEPSKNKKYDLADRLIQFSVLTTTTDLVEMALHELEELILFHLPAFRQQKRILLLKRKSVKIKIANPRTIIKYSDQCSRNKNYFQIQQITSSLNIGY